MLFCQRQLYSRRLPHIHHRKRRTALSSVPSVLFFSSPLLLFHFYLSASLILIFCSPFCTDISKREQTKKQRNKKKMHTSTSCVCPHVRRHKTDVQISSGLVVHRVVALITSRGKQSAAVSSGCSCCHGGHHLLFFCFFILHLQHACCWNSPIVLHPQRCCRS